MKDRSPKTAWNYFTRAMRWRCPLCGITPIFPPLVRTRTLRDWFTPLDGCPRCGYPYEREPGYFLLAIWAVNYGLGALLGIILYLILEWKFNLSTPALLLSVMIPLFVFNIAFARHAKSLFIAFDHFWDPHQRKNKEED